MLILGQGPIGLALTRLCALSGAGRLIVTDAREAPFAVSRAYGATECLNVTETDVVPAVAGLTGGAGADIVIETSGFPASINARPRAVWEPTVLILRATIRVPSGESAKLP